MAHKVKDFNLDGTYVERDATADEVKALQDRIDNKFNVMISDFRLHRNSLLRRTDWSSGSDVTMSDAMKTYDSYKSKRRAEYPQLAEQFDLLYKDIVAGTVTTNGNFAKAIKAVKDKYTKG